MKMMCKVYDFEASLLKAEVRKITKGDFLQDMKDYLGKMLDGRQRLTRSYLLSYPFFVKYFSEVENITFDKLILGVYLIYGWMPRALCFNEGKPLSQEDFVELRAKLSEVQKWSEKHFDEMLGKDGCASEKGKEEKSLFLLKKVTNGSIVGMSKLLHFINPKFFPIYDSNIAAVVGEVKTVDEYFAYVKAFHCFTKEILNHDSEEFERIRKDFEDACRKEFGNQTNMEVTTVRAIELVLFQIGKSIEDSKKTAKNP